MASLYDPSSTDRGPMRRRAVPQEQSAPQSSLTRDVTPPPPPKSKREAATPPLSKRRKAAVKVSSNVSGLQRSESPPRVLSERRGEPPLAPLQQSQKANTAAASALTMHGLPTPISPNLDPASIEVLKFPATRFEDFDQLRELLEEAENDPKNSYFYVNGVDSTLFAEIENWRDRTGRHFRLTFLADIETAIFKVPKSSHEDAHRTLSTCIKLKVPRLLIESSQLFDVGSTTYLLQEVVEGKSSKEGDSGFMNKMLRARKDWPCLVIESGLSESLTQLRIDADLWIRRSNGRVNMVILIHILKDEGIVTLEKWIPLRNERGRTQAHKLGQTIINTKEKDLSKAVTGDVPFVIEFLPLFDRPANIDEEEKDLEFSALELLKYAVDGVLPTLPPSERVWVFAQLVPSSK